jgi:hypothetical protein
MSEKSTVMCPSGRCQKGAVLLGLVGSDGTVSFISEKMVINDEFVQIARAGRTPEKRFRFAGRCVEHACKQWAGHECGVIEEVLKSVDVSGESVDLPNCSIRPQCRWYQQKGALACSVCPFVITDLMVDEKNK